LRNSQGFAVFIVNLTKAFLQCVYIQAVFIVYLTYTQAIIGDLSICRFVNLPIW